MKKGIVMLTAVIAINVASGIASEMQQYGFSISLSMLSTVPLFIMAHHLDRRS